jgi:hypothetical protein
MHRLLPLTGFGMSRSEYVHINRHFEFCPFTDHPGVFDSLLPVADGGIGASRQELSEIISGDIPTSSLVGRLEIRPRFRVLTLTEVGARPAVVALWPIGINRNHLGVILNGMNPVFP